MPDSTAENLEAFFLGHYERRLEAILLDPNEDLDFPLVVSFNLLSSEHMHLANDLFQRGAAVLRAMDSAAVGAQATIMHRHPQQAAMLVKPHVHTRVDMVHCEEAGPAIGGVRVRHVGKLIVLSGTVIRTGLVKMLEGDQVLECKDCGITFACRNEEGEAGPSTTRCPSLLCSSSDTRPAQGGRAHRDHQEIKIQERASTMDLGSAPRSIPVVLRDDLVDMCKGGDDLDVTGVVARRWRGAARDARCDVELVLLANLVRVRNDTRRAVEVTAESRAEFERYWEEHRKTPLQGRNLLLASICPQIYGLFTVKLAVALALVGGVPRVDPENGTRIRGESHLLLIGDPGTGKSQFLKYSSRLCPRSVVTTGRGTSGAGLTVTAVKEGGEWSLEAGALVMADGGLCCIDEFDAVREGDRTTIHEAMEQQTISVAKAGIVTTLPTRATVFGCCNPKGNYDPAESVAVNTSISAPLLSRFDVVLVLLDTKEPTWDRIVSDHILRAATAAGTGSQGEGGGGGTGAAATHWPFARLQQYLCYVKEEYIPVLTPEAEGAITRYYHLQRKAAELAQARTTIRMLESLIRLAHAHARLMCRRTVTLQDAVIAIALVESSMLNSAILKDVNALYTSFSERPDEEYLELEAAVLRQIKQADLSSLAPSPSPSEHRLQDEVRSTPDQRSRRASA